MVKPLTLYDLSPGYHEASTKKAQTIGFWNKDRWEFASVSDCTRLRITHAPEKIVVSGAFLHREIIDGVSIMSLAPGTIVKIGNYHFGVIKYNRLADIYECEGIEDD